MVLYEVQDLATLTSAAYLARLNAPSPWTTRIMACYRGMRRGLCSVLGSFGYGQGGCAALLRFAAPESRTDELHRWLLEEALPPLPRVSGLGSAHLLQGARAAAMTNEQRIRGADRGVESALIVTGYDGAAVAEQARLLVEEGGLPARGASEMTFAAYRFDYSLASAEIGA